MCAYNNNTIDRVADSDISGATSYINTTNTYEASKNTVADTLPI